MTETETAAPALLTRAQILESAKWAERDVDMPEWGGVLRLREQPADDIAAWQRANEDTDTETGDGVRAMASLVAMSAVDENGRRLFNEDDVLALKRKGVRALKRAFDAALEVNAIATGSVEEAEKN